MRASRLHVLFAILTAAFVCVAAFVSARLYRADEINRAIRAGTAETLTFANPEVSLSRALDWAKHDQYEEALKGYKALIDNTPPPLRDAALFNLGNLHLRRAIKQGGTAGQALPLIELAKQSYRDLLRRNPEDWDARYNLELSLRLSPEVEGEVREDEGPPMAKERAVTTMRGGKMDLP